MAKYLPRDNYIKLYDDEGNYIHTDLCGICGEEAFYITDPLVAVACPTDGCDGYFIHCDACIHKEVEWGNGGDCGNCPWREEACPETGAIVMILDDRPMEHKGLCPCGCGMSFTKSEHVHSWED